MKKTGMIPGRENVSKRYMQGNRKFEKIVKRDGMQAEKSFLTDNPAVNNSGSDRILACELAPRLGLGRDSRV